MLILIILLMAAGTLGGLLSYLVFFKGLRMPGDSTTNAPSFNVQDAPKFLAQLLDLLKRHWELAAYLLMGMAGALLVPLINEWVNGLKGIEDLMPKSTANLRAPAELKLSGWKQFLVFDYGIVFGYSANRLFGSLTGAVISRLANFTPKPGDTNIPSVRADFGLESINLTLGQKVPNVSETDNSASGPFQAAILRGSQEFNSLVENKNAKIVFKDEEGDGYDRWMTPLLKEQLDLLADSVQSEWGGAVKLRVTEAWDDKGEHSSSRSLHYEGRAADLTTSDLDKSKLPRLGRLAVEAGFHWVYYENLLHVHASVKRT